MTVNSGAYLKTMHYATKALGDKLISSDATFVVHGHESLYLLTKQFPHPYLTPGGEIEVAAPNGQAMWQAQQNKTHQQGGITFYETQAGHVRRFLEEVGTGREHRFDATIYEGTLEQHTGSYPIYDCFLVLDPGDRDWENRGQVHMVTGNLFFHYFGERKAGIV